MNEFAKLKDRKPSRLGTPPPASETRNNLSAPETAPVENNSIPKPSTPKKDGRTERATGRTEPFATRVREGVKRDYKLVAAQKNITMGQLIEDALKAYKKQNKI